jgi:predicted transcriptional regulator
MARTTLSPQSCKSAREALGISLAAVTRWAAVTEAAVVAFETGESTKHEARIAKVYEGLSLLLEIVQKSRGML